MPIVDDVNIGNLSLEDVLERKLVIGLDGRIHCVYYRKPALKYILWYAFSDDLGQTWTTEEPASTGGTNTQQASLVVDSENIPHIVFGDYTLGTQYIHRATGSWSAPIDVNDSFRVSATAGSYIVGETIQGQTSGAEAIIVTEAGTRIRVDNPHAGFQIDELLLGLTSGKSSQYTSDDNGLDGEALAIDSDDNLHLAASQGTKVYHLIKPPGGNWTHGQPTGLVSAGIYPPECAIGVDSNDTIHIAMVQWSTYQYVNGTRDSWGAVETICTGTTDWERFSMAVDLDDNPHVVVQQTGLGGDNDGILNIHYYKRTEAGWSTVEHITDDTDPREDPSIAVDKNGNIRVAFRGIGYGSYPLNENLVMRTKLLGGDWETVQVIVDRTPEQSTPNMLHALFPVSGNRRPSCPDGFAFIWNGQNADDLTVEYYTEIIEAVKAFPQMTLI